MNKISIVLVLAPSLLALTLFSAACSRRSIDGDEGPHVSGTASPEEAGRYLVTIGGCHDCHTPGFLQEGWAVPESLWFTGVPVGWRGPWGTTYGPNLRLTVQNLTEDAWVEMLRTRTSLPPMPWPLVNRMSERDMRAVYRYLKSLGVAGDAMPLPVPPDSEPATPYIVLAPPQGME
ncbi:MAG: hypothetical protein AMS21_09705 [Gemmatimonas sp. SG8_38_2]|nr:MAG: hypothetical protein AMS21_09705 [Gemmatimonas sp. SG8_38_2]